MLNIAIISLYMMLSSATGATTAQIPMSAPSTATPETPVQTVQERKENQINDAVDIETYVKEYFKDVPILAEVARCESHFRQTDSKGNVVRGKENRFDVGVMQINELYHSEQAENLKIDLHSLEGNLEYARMLYEKQGVYPWMASSPCWSKVKDLALKPKINTELNNS